VGSSGGAVSGTGRLLDRLSDAPNALADVWCWWLRSSFGDFIEAGQFNQSSLGLAQQQSCFFRETCQNAIQNRGSSIAQCLICGREFTPTKSWQKYCGPTHKELAYWQRESEKLEERRAKQQHDQHEAAA
jgi:hypothetical protein